jgi:hypothetical protein
LLFVQQEENESRDLFEESTQKTLPTAVVQGRVDGNKALTLLAATATGGAALREQYHTPGTASVFNTCIPVKETNPIKTEGHVQGLLKRSL